MALGVELLATSPTSELGVLPVTTGTAGLGGIAGIAADGPFGIGTCTGNGDLVGGTQPSPVTGTTGAGVFTGLDTFGIGDGFGIGFGFQMTPDGAGALY